MGDFLFCIFANKINIMKNKGRKHKKASNSEMGGILDCKGMLTHITRPITSMSSKGKAGSKFDKKKWSKRVRGYFKSQTIT